ncbi:MAG: signal peptidase I [Sphingomonadales bacterium]|nr:signal peptidase I [Sphingomonadales bacterium]MDE2568126.1 signal peptidase I [Sphingomonadales bacterium]
MTDTTDTAATPLAQSAPSPAPAPEGSKPAKKHKEEDNFFVFLIKLAVVVLVFRSFIFSPFNIPSESMLPKLVDGDYLLAAKWPYGFSRYSMPFSIPLIPGRVLPHDPKRGDVVIFKAPPGNDVDYIKRVVGLPGDTVQMLHGQVILNGKPIPKVRVADFTVAVSPNTHCYDVQFEKTTADGQTICSYPRFRETLPGGKSYDVLDLGARAQDDTTPVLVPEGHLFLMGDNRDNSLDSRFPAIEGGGIGLVPEKNLVGRAEIIMWSTDGSASWINPISWFTAARWNRIGTTF